MPPLRWLAPASATDRAGLTVSSGLFLVLQFGFWGFAVLPLYWLLTSWTFLLALVALVAAALAYTVRALRTGSPHTGRWRCASYAWLALGAFALTWFVSYVPYHA